MPRTFKKASFTYVETSQQLSIPFLPGTESDTNGLWCDVLEFQVEVGMIRVGLSPNLEHLPLKSTVNMNVTYFCSIDTYGDLSSAYALFPACHALAN
jgi:hypothetical protein